MSYDYIKLYPKASEIFSKVVAELESDDLGLPTPCTDWNVRQLLNHVTYEVLWVPPLLGGKTITEVGGQFEGDLLGVNPRLAWNKAAAGAVRAMGAVRDPKLVTHLSFGDTPVAEYAKQLVIDLVIHGWDLATAIGAGTDFAAEAVEAAYAGLKPEVAEWRKAGVFGQEVKTEPRAGLLAKLIALSGRQP